MRIAHVTDLHLLSLEGLKLHDFVNKRWMGGLNLLLNRGKHYLVEVFDALIADLNSSGVELVICTGDVSNLSLESEFRFARERFDRIAVGAGNVLCIPGNHDNYIAEVAGRFETVFAPYCAADDEWRWSDGDMWPTVRVRGSVAMIGLSTSQPSGWLAGHGTVGEKQLGRLDELLGDARLSSKLRVIAMHHPSVGRHATNKRRGLLDHAAFAKVIAARGAELILHGHEHLDLRNALPVPGGATVPVLGVQSGTYAIDKEKRRARYRVFDVEDHPRGLLRPRLLGHALRTWRPTSAAFEAESEKAA